MFADPQGDQLDRALESWSWIGIEGKRPIRVTAFGDVFFVDNEGTVWFLDTLGGSLSAVFGSTEEMDQALETEDGQDTFLFAGFVQRAVEEGMRLKPGECYDWKINPVIGGSVEFENIHVLDLVVAINVAGQIHEQTRHLPPGTIIAGFNVVE